VRARMYVLVSWSEPDAMSGSCQYWTPGVSSPAGVSPVPLPCPPLRAVQVSSAPPSGARPAPPSKLTSPVICDESMMYGVTVRAWTEVPKVGIAAIVPG